MKDWEKQRPTIGIVLGSGLGILADRMQITGTLPYGLVPELPVSRVVGHAGQFVFGSLGGREVVMAQGRVHLYEGYSAAEVTAGVRFLATLGVRQLILTNAAGTLNPVFHPGSWMMLSDHINLTGTSPLVGPTFLDLTEAYSWRLREAFRTAASRPGVTLHEGVYASLSGPQYETPAEVRMLRTLGADAVGMSTVLETIQARALGLEVVAFSCLTNWAAGLGDGALGHDEVITTGRNAAAHFADLLEQVLLDLA